MKQALSLLDVNVVMYAAGIEHHYKQACAWLILEVAAGRVKAAIDTETIQEILYRYMKIQQWRFAIDMAQNLIDAVTVVLPIRLADMLLCMQLCESYGPHGLSARDLIHVAVMQNNELDTIISTDQDFDRIDGIRRLDPFDLFSRRVPG